MAFVRFISVGASADDRGERLIAHIVGAQLVVNSLGLAG